MDIQGLTPIDTLYEYTGYSVSLQVGKYLIWNGYIVGFILSAALLRLYYLGAREGSYKDLAIYPVYVLFIFFLLWPVPVALTAPKSQTGGFLEETNPENGLFWDTSSPLSSGNGNLVRPDTLRVPRILAYVSALVGALQKNLVSDICDEMHSAMYQWKHIAAINSNTRIFNRALREDLGVYLQCCYYPALTQDQSQDHDPWKSVPLAGLPIDDTLIALYQQLNLYALETHQANNKPSTCVSLHQGLSFALIKELVAEDYHQKALAAYDRIPTYVAGSLNATGYRSFYQRRLIYNQMFLLGTSSVATMREALPDYHLLNGGLLDMKYITSETADHGLLASLKNSITKLPHALAAIASALSEGFSQKAMGPATYYRVSALGPYMYGLLLALLIISFPLAGLLAFWPQWWTSIVNFMKLFVSVKLWPIFWAYLSGMMSYREAFNAEDPEGFQGTFGSEGMLPALALMFLVVPVFSFMITSIAQHAGGAVLGALLGQGQEASLGSTLGAVTGPARTAVQLSHDTGGKKH